MLCYYCQILGGAFRTVGLTSATGRRSFSGTDPDGVFQVLDDADGLEGAGDHLSGADPVAFFGELALEQLGISQNHAELVVQAVEEADQFRSHFRGGR